MDERRYALIMVDREWTSGTHVLQWTQHAVSLQVMEEDQGNHGELFLRRIVVV